MELTGSPSIEEAVREAAERRARAANARDLWDGIWKREGEDSWRQHALERVYKRITKLLSKGTGRGLTYGPVYDVGGGAGLLAAQIAAKGLWTVVWDHSESALRIAQDAGIETLNVDLEAEANPPRFLVAESHPAVVATEVLEHLSDRARRRLLAAASEEAGCAIFSVPNNRLGPDEEPQHTIKWTALEFLTLLREFWGKRCRVEVMGPFLLGVCGDLADKPYTLSVTFPARDEAADIEATLASFRGIADEMVIGIDYRTKDNTEEIARRYAEKVFIIDDPQGPPDDQAPQVHFSHCRNRCIRECSGDWIFMTEAHERLGKGQDILLHLDEALPEGAKIGVVQRTAHGQRDKWFFEWLFRNDPDNIHFKRPTHNFLVYPEGSLAVLLPGVMTIHDRVHERTEFRRGQRKVQNRLSLMEDWRETGSEGALLYLGFEWREYDDERAIRYLEELIAMPSKNGPMRYMAKFVLAKLLVQCRNDVKTARQLLHSMSFDDWARTEHWLMLGDLAHATGQLQQAHVFYKYSAVRIGDAPITQWWYDGPFYTYLPAQRLAMVCGEMGLLDEGLKWARIVVEQIPDDAPEEVMAEARDNVRLFEDALARRAARQGDGDDDEDA